MEREEGKKLKNRE